MIAILVQVIEAPGNGGVIIPREQSVYAGSLQSFGCNRLCNLASSPPAYSSWASPVYGVLFPGRV